MIRQKEKNSKAKSLELVGQIQPQGGISFYDERFIRKGDGYEACIHVYAYPNEVAAHWLMDLTNIGNAVTTIDIGTQDINEAKKNINRSMGEQRSRYSSGKSDSELLDAKELYSQLHELYQELNSMGEVMKLVHARIYAYAQTTEELEKDVSGIINNLTGRGYKAAIFLGETRQEWQSLYKSFEQQKTSGNSRPGQPILSETLAGGYPFHFTSLSDPMGTSYGETQTGGSVLFDPFHTSRQRTSFNGLVVGKSGFGKSTFLKKLMRDRAIRGDFIRGIDVKGDFTGLVRHLGGKIVTLDGSDGLLNALEIFRTNELDTVSFSNHISKLNKFYRFLVPSASIYEVTEFETAVRILYGKLGLSPEKGRQITGLAPGAYPIFSDLLDVIRSELYADYVNHTFHKGLDSGRKQRLLNLELIIGNLIQSYGHMFDGHTTIPRLQDEQVVFFNAQSLANMKDEIFDVQIFSCLSLLWDNLVSVGGRMKKLYDTNQIDLEDVTRYMIILDEAHRIVNTDKVHTVDYLLLFEREARAMFGGLWLASQGIRDFVPEGSGSVAVGKIKTLFELTQYKVIFQQDSNARDSLLNIFSGQLTADEAGRITKFERGECIMLISGDRNVHFHVNITKFENHIFQGGV